MATRKTTTRTQRVVVNPCSTLEQRASDLMEEIKQVRAVADKAVSEHEHGTIDTLLLIAEKAMMEASILFGLASPDWETFDPQKYDYLKREERAAKRAATRAAK